MRRIPIAGPWITDREVEYAADAARNAWYEHWNDFNARFEQAFAGYAGVPHAISLPSCTSAIHLALAALGVGPGDEVIVPDVTWIATAAPISYVGATTVFADIDETTWCLAADALEARITPRTRAVIPVDLYGGMPDLEAIREIAARHGIAVIEDAAEAVGSEYGGSKAGTLGDVGVFSFHGSKTMTTGEGGMLVTHDEALYRRCLMLRDQGRNPESRTQLFNEEVGFKYRMSGVQAAIGLAQLERIDELVERKREIFGWYRERLGSNPALTLNAEAPGTRNTYWMVTAIFDRSLGVTKERVIERLGEAAIDCRPFFYPLSSLPAFDTTPAAAEARRSNCVAYELSPRGVNLPSALNLTAADVERVCDAVEDVLRTP